MYQGSNSHITYYKDRVIKEVTGDELDEPLDVAAAREVHIMVKARSKYKYVPKFYSLNGTKITMERIYGDILAEYIMNNATEASYEWIVRSVKKAVDHLVHAGIHHRDVTPKNIIISDNNIWIIDFGFADIIDEYSAKIEKLVTC